MILRFFFHIGKFRKIKKSAPCLQLVGILRPAASLHSAGHRCTICVGLGKTRAWHSVVRRYRLRVERESSRADPTQYAVDAGERALRQEEEAEGATVARLRVSGFGFLVLGLGFRV